LDVAEHPAGTDRGKLLVITDEPDTAAPINAFHEGKRSEGAMLDVPGVVNFNHTAGGDNVIIQTG